MAARKSTSTKKPAEPKKPAPASPAPASKPFAPAGPVHWGYPFTVHVRGERGERIREFLSRFTSFVPASDLSGYGVVDDHDTATAAKVFNRNRPCVTASDIERQSPEGLDEPSRLARLDRALATPSGENYSELHMLLATWPEDQHPAEAEVRALAALESWPAFHRCGAHRTEEAASRGDLTLHKKFVRAQGSQDLAEKLPSGLYDDTALLYVDDLDVFLTHREGLPKVRELNLRGVPTTAQWDALKSTPLDAIAVQHFEMKNPTGLDTARWWDAPLGRGLKYLCVYGVKVGRDELAPLTRGEPRLRHLKMENARLTGATAGKALAQIGALHPIESLTLPYNELGPEGLTAMFSGQGFTSLRAADLSANEVGDAGAVALARSEALGALRWLTLRSNAADAPITAEGAKALAEAASLRDLHSLFLMGQPVLSEGVAALLSSRALPRLRALNVAYANATWGELIERLRDVETVPVTHLDASSWYGGPRPDWKAARFLRSVTHLRAESIDGGELGRFLACGNLDRVESLILGGMYANHDKAAKALRAAEALPSLRFLSLHGWKMGVPQAKALIASPLIRALEGIDLMASGYVKPEAAQVFLDAGVRVVTSPEFNEYVANDTRLAELAYEPVAD